MLTSGNVSDEPIAYRDDDVLERLGGIADAFLTHDRPIHIRTDDSVVRVFRGRDLPIRRSRGYVPHPLPLAVAAARPVLACGAELKHTFCLVKGDRAFVSHHIGDLENYETLRSFTEESSISGGCSTSRPRSSRTTCTPTICPPSGRSTRTRTSSACSTTTPTSRPAWPTTASIARSRARSREWPSTASATGRTARCGAASSSSPT